MYSKELNAAIEAALRAKDEILKVYHQSFEVEIKEDDSPVTIADKRADEIIRAYLSSIFPTHAFLTEESEDNLDRLNNDYVWIVDPVDGTKDFIAKDDEFTTNIALAYKHEIVVGVICVPAKDELYFASKDSGAFFLKDGVKTQIFANKKTDNLTCLTSVFHMNKEEEDLIEKHKDKICYVSKAGSSLKACYIASGKAELSYRMSPNTKEWDTAASEIIISESGAVMVKPDLVKMTYNRKDVYNREGYIIANIIENVLL